MSLRAGHPDTLESLDVHAAAGAAFRCRRRSATGARAVRRRRRRLASSERARSEFRVGTAAGDRFVLKIANGPKSGLLEAQNAALAHVRGRRRSVRACSHGGQGTIASAIRPFGPAADVAAGGPLGPSEHCPRRSSRSSAAGAGARRRAGGLRPSGRPSRLLLGPGARPALVRELAPSIPDPPCALVRMARRYFRRDGPRFAALRRAVVHNDPNDYNVLVDGANGPRVIEILDFGDIVHSYAIADLAIAVAYAVLGKADPLGAASPRPRLPASGRWTTTRSPPCSRSSCCGCARASASRRGSSRSGPATRICRSARGRSRGRCRRWRRSIPRREEAFRARAAPVRRKTRWSRRRRRIGAALGPNLSRLPPTR